MTEEATKPTGYSGHAYFSIDDLAAMQPGLARIMPEIGQRYWKLYYAAKASNWPLAKFQLGEIEELMEFGSVTRPKYAEGLETFVREDLGTMKSAIEKKDWESFEIGVRPGRPQRQRLPQVLQEGHDRLEAAGVRAAGLGPDPHRGVGAADASTAAQRRTRARGHPPETLVGPSALDVFPGLRPYLRPLS